MKLLNALICLFLFAFGVAMAIGFMIAFIYKLNEFITVKKIVGGLRTKNNLTIREKTFQLPLMDKKVV